MRRGDFERARLHARVQRVRIPLGPRDDAAARVSRPSTLNGSDATARLKPSRSRSAVRRIALMLSGVNA